MANTIGKWNPAWGPEPQWQGPVSQKPRLRWYRVSCPCAPEGYLVHQSGTPDYTCTHCGATMQTIRAVRERKPTATSVQPGERYGRLTVVEVFRRGKIGSGARCRCDCGVVKVVASHHLRDGSTKSCGCLRWTPPPLHPWRSDYKTDAS